MNSEGLEIRVLETSRPSPQVGPFVDCAERGQEKRALICLAAYPRPFHHTCPYKIESLQRGPQRYISRYRRRERCRNRNTLPKASHRRTAARDNKACLWPSGAPWVGRDHHAAGVWTSIVITSHSIKRRKRLF